jgi:uncharacterized SAM-binding protein YcdF (DUF218 family)
MHKLSKILLIILLIISPSLVSLIALQMRDTSSESEAAGLLAASAIMFFFGPLVVGGIGGIFSFLVRRKPNATKLSIFGYLILAVLINVFILA